jgi:hypothetical protein
MKYRKYSGKRAERRQSGSRVSKIRILKDTPRAPLIHFFSTHFSDSITTLFYYFSTINIFKKLSPPNFLNKGNIPNFIYALAPNQESQPPLVRY